MKLFSFPLASLEKAVNKRMLSLQPEHKEWFGARWQQKPYKKSFLDNKALPLVTIVAKCKSMEDEEFNQVMAEWDAKFYEAEAEVLRMRGDIAHFVATWLPCYVRDHRNYLTVGIGCTGGQHRSVYLAEWLASEFRDRARVLVRHRELAPTLSL